MLPYSNCSAPAYCFSQLKQRTYLIRLIYEEVMSMYKVIIVEDDPMVASINQQYLERNQNLKIVGQFRNGQEALKYLKDNHYNVKLQVIFFILEKLYDVNNFKQNDIYIKITPAFF